MNRLKVGTPVMRTGHMRSEIREPEFGAVIGIKDWGKQGIHYEILWMDPHSESIVYGEMVAGIYATEYIRYIGNQNG